jgi:hypothetical protein
MHFILARSIFISFIQLNIALLLVWTGVYYGLKPLIAVRGVTSRKGFISTLRLG